MKELVLRPRQLQSIDGLRDGIRQGHNAQILMAGTGAGKTICATHLIQQAAAKSRRAMFICDRVQLINQTSATFDAFGIQHGVLQASHWRFRPYERIQVASVQTLMRRGIPDGIDLFIVDECFPAGTMISTPKGQIPIELVKAGDAIYNAFGETQVISVFSKSTQALVHLRLSNGRIIRCTADHPFFTDSGWKSASALGVGTRLYGDKTMCKLRETIRTVFLSRKNRRSSLPDGGWVQRSKMLWKILCEEVEQPDAQSGVSGQDGVDVETLRASTKISGRQWPRIDETATEYAAKSRRGLGSRVNSKNENEAISGLPSSLQNRFSKRGDDDRSRARWLLAFCDSEAAAGQQERCASEEIRVAGIEIVEYPSGINVYNLRVSSHPSYFADGVLVHNCHTVYTTIKNLITARSNARFIGLSATPFTKGLSKLYSNIVNAMTTNDLLNDGWLTPLAVYVGKRADMDGVKINSGGEWDDEETSKRNLEIVGDIVTTWQEKCNEHFGGPAKTIGFTASVDDGAVLCKRFKDAGFRFEQISYRTPEDEREALMAEFKRHETDIVGLLSVEALAKGFDQADIKIGIDARPLRKSLSGHIQMIGRVMRPLFAEGPLDMPEQRFEAMKLAGKELAIWICHSGNFMRFAADRDEIFQHGLSELDNGDFDDRVRQEPQERVAKDIVCPKCSFVLSPELNACPRCGTVRERRSLVEHVPGEMVRYEGSPLLNASTGRKLPDWMADKASVWNQICAISLTEKRGDPEKAKKLALGQYKGFYGEWPEGEFSSNPLTRIDPRMESKFHAAKLQYFKKIKKEKRAA